MGLSNIFKKTLSVESGKGSEEEIFDFELEKSIEDSAKVESLIPSLNVVIKEATIFKDLKDETVEKIKNNPFWNEYSPHSQEKMVSKYFDNKIKRSKYRDLKYSLNDKRIFIEDVLKSVV
ncbi:hypothetical protein J6N69_01260 [bacterium]|nr:hypothetical protein [bacterium]